MLSYFFFFNDTATTEIYTLSLHDALPIFLAHQKCIHRQLSGLVVQLQVEPLCEQGFDHFDDFILACFAFGLCSDRSEEHTSELQSQSNLVCRLLLEKKKI